MYLVASVCPFADTLMPKPFDLRPSFLAWGSTLTFVGLGLWAKVVGHRLSRYKMQLFRLNLFFYLRPPGASMKLITLCHLSTAITNPWECAN